MSVIDKIISEVVKMDGSLMELLPSELGYELMTYLPNRSRLDLTTTSRTMSGYRTDLFWERLVKTRFPERSYYPPNGDWKKYYGILLRQQKKAEVFEVEDERLVENDMLQPDDLMEKMTSRHRRHLLDEGMRHGDVVRLDGTDDRYVYNESNKKLVMVSNPSEPAIGDPFEVVRRFPIQYWRSGFDSAVAVTANLYRYRDQIRNNMEPVLREWGLGAKTKIVAYQSHFVYENDHTGNDNRYDILFYSPGSPRGEMLDLTDAKLVEILRRSIYYTELHGFPHYFEETNGGCTLYAPLDLPAEVLDAMVEFDEASNDDEEIPDKDPDDDSEDDFNPSDSEDF